MNLATGQVPHQGSFSPYSLFASLKKKYLSLNCTSLGRTGNVKGYQIVLNIQIKYSPKIVVSRLRTVFETFNKITPLKGCMERNATQNYNGILPHTQQDDSYQ